MSAFGGSVVKQGEEHLGKVRKSVPTLNVGTFNVGNFLRPTRLPDGSQIKNQPGKNYWGKEQFEPNEFNTLLDVWGENICQIICTQEARTLKE